jgi:hypothetical protein
MRVKADSDIGREMLRLDEELRQEVSNPDTEYGAGERSTPD